jgi:hypothetical protein
MQVLDNLEIDLVGGACRWSNEEYMKMLFPNQPSLWPTSTTSGESTSD